MARAAYGKGACHKWGTGVIAIGARDLTQGVTLHLRTVQRTQTDAETQFCFVLVISQTAFGVTPGGIQPTWWTIHYEGQWPVLFGSGTEHTHP